MSVTDRRAHIDLLEAYRKTGDRAARDRLVEELMPLVRSLARRYAGRGEPVDRRADVFAIGTMLWELCAARRLPPGTAAELIDSDRGEA